MGHDVEAMWAGLKEGKSGVGYTTIFDASKFPTKISAEVKNWDITQTGEDAEVWKYRGRHTKFAGGAAKQAVAQSGVLDASLDPTRFGVYLGCGEGSQDFHVVLADDDRGPHARRRSTWPSLPSTGLEILNPDGRDRAGAEHAGRATWPACSTPRGRTPTA